MESLVLNCVESFVVDNKSEIEIWAENIPLYVSMATYGNLYNNKPWALIDTACPLFRKTVPPFLIIMERNKEWYINEKSHWELDLLSALSEDHVFTELLFIWYLGNLCGNGTVVMQCRDGEL